MVMTRLDAASCAAADAHAGHHEEIPVQLDLLRAVVAPAAGRLRRTSPQLTTSDWLRWPAVSAEEAFPPLRENRQDLRQFVVAPDVIEAASGHFHGCAEDQGDRPGPA